MNKNIPAFEAKCAQCASQFDHPGIGDFTYGENIFYTIDGRQKVWVSALSTFPQRVISMLDPSRSKKLWDILASLADPVDGQKLVARIVCPYCASDHMDYWSGNQIGVASLQEAMFLNSGELDELALRLKLDGSI